MRRFLLLLALVALLALSGLTVQAKAEQADELLAEDVVEDTVDATAKKSEQPGLSPEAFAKIFQKLSNKCQKEIEANPSDPEKLTPRCRNELGRKIERHLQREKEGPKEPKKPKETKPKKKKKVKQTRAQKEAAAALKKEEEYNETVKVIVGFIGTLIAVVLGTTFFINRKLKAAGMYYPADPAAPATGGCCG